MKRTIVFYKIRAAIHAKNPDGTRKYKYILLTGSSRSSKTTSAIQNYFVEAWNNENKRLSVWRDTKKDCKDTVGKDMEKKVFPTMPYYSPSNVVFNKTESIYTFPSKSTIEICGTDDADKVHGFNGDIAWLNEPYNISKDTFDQIDMRTEEFVIIDMNPKQAHWSDDLQKDPRCKVIHSTFKDNQYCPREQRIKILGYQPVKMCYLVESKLLTEEQAHVYDITTNVSGFEEKHLKELSRCRENERKRSADGFKWAVYGLGIKAEKPNRIFQWEEIPDDEYHRLELTKYFASDWGAVDPWGILEAKYVDHCLYLHERNYESENEIMAKLTPSTIEQIRTIEEGLIGWRFNLIGIPKTGIIVCDNNRPKKVTALRAAGYEYAITAEKGADSILEGIDTLRGLKVYYTSSSKNLKNEQENYERTVDRYGVVLEEPIDKDNHLMDCARYIVSFLKTQQIIKGV